MDLFNKADIINACKKHRISIRQAVLMLKQLKQVERLKKAAA